MAHSDAEMLEILIRMLDDRRNDIFIMLDAKSDESKFKNVRCYYSNLFSVITVLKYIGDM